LRLALGKKHEIVPEKYLKQKRTGCVAQMVEHLPTKLEALSSNTNKKKEEEEEEEDEGIQYTQKRKNTRKGVSSLIKTENLCVSFFFMFKKTLSYTHK
jgi:hypothetical protein